MRSIARTQIEAYAKERNELLLFRPQPVLEVPNSLQTVDAVSLGCVIRASDARTVMSVVVMIFDEHPDIRIGDSIKVIGMLTYEPTFHCPLIQRSSTNPISKMLSHDEYNAKPPGVRRIHALFHDRQTAIESPDLA